MAGNDGRRVVVLLMVLFFAPWWLVGIGLSGGLMVYGLQATS